MTDFEQDARIQRLHFFLGITVRQLDNIVEAAKRLDTKASVILGFDGIILSIVSTSATFPNWGISIVSPALLFSFAFSLWAFFPRRYRRDPDVRNLVTYYEDITDNNLLSQLITNTIDSIEENEQRHCSKVWKVKWSMSLLFAGLILTVIVILVQGG